MQIGRRPTASLSARKGCCIEAPSFIYDKCGTDNVGRCADHRRSSETGTQCAKAADASLPATESDKLQRLTAKSDPACISRRFDGCNLFTGKRLARCLASTVV